jgi:putative ABC transport system substrate-binding protein
MLRMASGIAALGAVAPDVLHAQRPATQRRIGVLFVAFAPESKEVADFRTGLRDAGYVDGRDVVIEWRFAGGHYDRVPGLASDLIAREVEVIVVTTTRGAQLVKQATSSIPIVIALVTDPVGAGLVPSLAHPGGNVTGLSAMTVHFSAKRLQLLKETLPRLTRVAVLWNPATPWHPLAIEELRKAAQTLSIELLVFGAKDVEDFEQAFSGAVRGRSQGLYIIESPLFFSSQANLVKLAMQARLPTMSGERRFTEDGGLISYGTNLGDLLRRSAGYVDRILRGAKPGDLPIEQPSKFEFVVNLRTAKALGLTIPQSVLFQADEVFR